VLAWALGPWNTFLCRAERERERERDSADCAAREVSKNRGKEFLDFSATHMLNLKTCQDLRMGRREERGRKEGGKGEEVCRGK
jgi:hypothetical protein